MYLSAYDHSSQIYCKALRQKGKQIMSETVISVKNLTKTYRLYENTKQRILEGLFPFVKPRHQEFHALDNVSFDIHKGEIVGIIGKNGSGKSTLLKIITGVLQGSEGTVDVKGRVSALLELGSGFNPEYTGIENIYMNGTLMGVTREEMGKRVQEIVDFADIGDFINQPVKNYSSGMFVRLAFAVAINVDADILIVDEALAVGDVAFQAKCMAKMSQIMKKGTTILFVTHDMNTVKRLCQRCIYLKKGKKVMEGPAEELADIYLREVREGMNAENQKVDIVYKENQVQMINREDVDTTKVAVDPEFDKRVAQFREGNGTVRVTSFELTDMQGNKIKAADFNQKIKLRIALEFKEDKSVAVSYHIRDDKNLELLGSSTRVEMDSLLQGKKGERYLVEFATKVPLVEGAYNITLVVSEPVILNRTALFNDYIEYVAVFEVLENPRAKLWDKVYVNNDLKIYNIV